jgi:hypothetical protein
VHRDTASGQRHGQSKYERPCPVVLVPRKRVRDEEDAQRFNRRSRQR